MQSESILTRPAPPADGRIAYGPAASQFLEVRRTSEAGKLGVVFFVHGGYWRNLYGLDYAGHLCAALSKAGLTTWNIEYRRLGDEGGGWPGTLEDVRAAYRKARSLSVSNGVPSNLCVAGHSAGGQLAFWLAAAEPTVTRALSLAGVLNLRQGSDLHLSDDAVAEFLGGSPAQVPEHYAEASPAERKLPHVRQVLIHGTADDIVPYAFSQNYAALKTRAGEPVELITLPGASHFEIVDPASPVWNQVERAFVTLCSR